jgi:murein DD-endopeptidase MepM/ murein hydrolase activator NlpD
MLRSSLVLVLVLAATALLGHVVWPNAWFTARLWFEEAPQALPVPVEGLEARRVADSWGNARTEGRHHEGIDLFAPRGRPIRATTHGVVWKVGRDRLGGNVVFVLGPGRQLHYYAHLDHFAPITVGERVEVGTVLGYVGDSGNAKGGPTHLHYGIYVLGGEGAAPSGAINPYPLLRAGAATGTQRS